MPASAQRACYSSNWHDSQRDPPPQIQLADISSTAAQTALTPQTSASCQPLPIGSDTLGPPASTPPIEEAQFLIPIGKASDARAAFAASTRQAQQLSGKSDPVKILLAIHSSRIEATSASRASWKSRVRANRENQTTARQCCSTATQRDEFSMIHQLSQSNQTSDNERKAI